MKIEHLEERIKDYKKSIETVVEKKILWKSITKDLLLNTLHTIAEKYKIGWRAQELNWMNTNEAVNITFDSFPPDLIEKTNQIPTFQFIQGSALVFSQLYSGDIQVFTLFPILENSTETSNDDYFCTYTPDSIDEKLIIEKVDEFLKKMIQWEIPTIKNKVGF
jgi:hypothetical protein